MIIGIIENILRQKKKRTRKSRRTYRSILSIEMDPYVSCPCLHENIIIKMKRLVK